MKFVLALLMIVPSSLASATDLKLKITFPRELQADKIQIWFNDGGVTKSIIPELDSNGTVVLTDHIESLYATLLILYRVSEKKFDGQQFVVNDQSTFITFLKGNSENIFANYKSENVFVFSKSEEYKALRTFGKKEFEEHKAASAAYKITVNEKTLAALNLTSKNTALKDLEYIKTHGNNYWYFWLFYSDVAQTLRDSHQLELYEVYNTAFPEKFKNSFEGQNLKKFLIGNIGFKNGDPVPDFTTKDIYGNDVSTKANRGKFMIINFWATWCSPCVAEIPFLKKLRDTYHEKDLAIISISIDKDPAAFKKGIEKYKMNWTQVRTGNDSIGILFGNKPIPSLYLIGPDGTLKFSNFIDFDPKILEKILAENIARK